MVLISEGYFSENCWHLLPEGEAWPFEQDVLIPLERVSEGIHVLRKGRLGLLVPNTTEVADVAPYFDKVALLAVNFPAFSDGRGFSLARQLRRAGFKKELRAFGSLLPDQYASALACGFNTIEIADDRALRMPQEQWRAAYQARAVAYQRGYAHVGSILDRRRAAK
jgi:uncharacterized protein (DUF934 family)